MPAPIMTKEAVLDRLTKTFRESGYDGASLSELSAATGLGKSSLYHYFPGGKVDMAEQVLAHLDDRLEGELFEPLRSNEPPETKLNTMLDTIASFYDGGKNACLLERLSASVDRDRFRRPLTSAFAKWLEAVEAIGVEAKLPRSVARARAEDLIIRIEGALVVCAGTGDTKPFERTITALRAEFFAPARAPRKSKRG